jgi:hypothetical protein
VQGRKVDPENSGGGLTFIQLLFLKSSHCPSQQARHSHSPDGKSQGLERFGASDQTQGSVRGRATTQIQILKTPRNKLWPAASGSTD